jgi:hypothetical protein
MKEPKIFKNLLSNEDFISLKNHILDIPRLDNNFSKEFNRYEFGETEVLNSVHQNLTHMARDFFESSTLMPTFNFGAFYFGDASLLHHTDVAACTYSIDLCVDQKEPWDLWVEGKAYTLEENEALFYYGESQEHWREKFPNPGHNTVANVFFFFAEPDHWFFNNPRESHIDIMRENYKKTVQYRNEISNV